MTNYIPSKLVPFKRKTWKPVVTDGDGSRTASKFSGQPYLPENETHPHCRNCNKPLQLFIQLNLNDLPPEVRNEFGKGLIQLFYCTSEDPLCEVDCEAFFPFAKSVLARLIEIENENPNTPEFLLPANSFAPKVIEGWQEMDDYPNVEESGSLGIDLEDSEKDDLYESEFPQTGDKLAGYPMWVQGVEYPGCPVCGEKMRLLFQIDSEDNLPFMFGDIGCGHLTQCINHKDQLAFGWACG